LEKVTYNNDPYAKCEVAVHLLDFGENVKVLLHEVTALPVQYTAIAPMIIKCDLDGVIPVAADFSKVAVQYFKTLVLDKEVLVTYKSREIHVRNWREEGEPLDPNALQDDFLYSVQLRLRDFAAEEIPDKEADHEDILNHNANLIRDRHDIQNKAEVKVQPPSGLPVPSKPPDIAHQLHVEGYCLLLNPFPKRSKILNGGFPSLSLAGAMLMAPDPEDLVRMKSFQRIMERERQRVSEVLKRRDDSHDPSKDAQNPREYFIKFPAGYVGARGRGRRVGFCRLQPSDDDDSGVDTRSLTHFS